VRTFGPTGLSTPGGSGGATTGGATPGAPAGPAAPRDPERVRVAAAQFAGELRTADTARGLDRVIPPRMRQSLVIQGRLADERAKGNVERARTLENLARDLGALPAGAGRERRYEFSRSRDGAAVTIRATELNDGRPSRDLGGTSVRYSDFRDFLGLLATSDGRHLGPSAVFTATVPIPDTD
jgi:hypothetical protein